MRRIYELNKSEIDKVQFSVRFIDNRLERPYYIDSNKKYSKKVHKDYYSDFRRWDMFWVNCTFEDFYLGSACIDPILNTNDPGRFIVSKNHCEVTQENWFVLAERIREYFMKTSQYKQQKKWIKEINIKIAWDKKELEEY